MSIKLRALAQSLISELNESGEAKDRESSKTEWWRQLDWKSPDLRTLFDSLGEETQKLITEAGLVKDDLVEEEYQGNTAHMTLSERAKRFHSISDDDWAALTETEKEDYINKLPPEKPEDGETNKDEEDADDGEDSEDCEDCDEDDTDAVDDVEDVVDEGAETTDLNESDVDEVEKGDKLDPDEVLAKYRRTVKDKDYPQ